MKICRFCGKPSPDNETAHKKCLKGLFGIEHMPKIDLSLSEISIKAQKMAGRLSISGVQPKLSMKLNRKAKELETCNKLGELILKPQTQTFPNLAQNEALCMNIASSVGIDVPPHGLIELSDKSLAYVVRRFDRDKNNKIHQEDFFQLLGKEDKYKGSLEEIGSKLYKISDVPGFDVQLFYERILFFFIIGNGDAHFKNFSISFLDNGQIRLSPAYDIVCSKLVIPDEEDFALTMNGKRNKLTGKDFIAFVQYLKIPIKVIEGKFLNEEQNILNYIEHSELTADEKTRMKIIVQDRYARLREI